MADLQTIERITKDSNKVRNFCLLAHVDHGKTTLSDFLIASNGIMSTALAGTVRFLDSRPDEQVRLITMKASAIALTHTARDKTEHVLNLVDAPGHIDFSSEVSTAIRLCDGAIVVVDAVDGVTAQTVQLLHEAFINNLSMILVINKMDLLVTRLQLTPSEAYYRMRIIIESCNAALAAFVNTLTITRHEDLSKYAVPDDEVWFSPGKGNVIFASCWDKWALSVNDMTPLYAAKFGMDESVLRESFWGDHYLDLKNKRVVDKPVKSTQEPMAVQLLLTPIWELYRVFDEEEYDEEKATTISSKLGIEKRRWSMGKEPKSKLQFFMGAWLPLARSVMNSVCECMYSPSDSQKIRVPSFLPSDGVPENLKNQLVQCANDDDTPAVAFISKLIDIQTMAGQITCYDNEEQAFEEAFICFTRVLCGTLRKGSTVIVQSGGACVTRTVKELYILRGRGLEPVDSVNAGCICGLGGFATDIVKHATISTIEMPPLVPIDLMSSSIVRVSVSPENPSEMPKLLRGLQMLNQVDAQVQVTVLATGQHVLCCAGEVHLDRCIKDLTENFARTKLIVSDPIHHFRETIVCEDQSPETVVIDSCGLSIKISIVQVPEEVLNVMKDDHHNKITPELMNSLEQIMHKDVEEWKFSKNVIDIGPRKFGFCGTMLLVSDAIAAADEYARLLDTLKSGFQLASLAGTVAEEPLFGLAIVIEDVDGDVSELTASSTGMVMTAIKDGVREAFDQGQRRLVEPMYHCTVFSAGNTQGKIYASLNRRRGQIIEEVPNEGSDMFHIDAYLPVTESFGLQDDLRIATHGAATAQLRIDHWATIDADPFFQPKTRDEIEDFGTTVTVQNVAAQLVEKIRRRKGIHRENIVEDAEKQKFSIRGA